MMGAVVKGDREALKGNGEVLRGARERMLLKEEWECVKW